MDIALWTAIIGVLGTLVAALLVKLFERREVRLRERKERTVTVERIQDPSNPTVQEALRLYERRIPLEEQDEQADIVRWLREIQGEKERGVCKLEDYFLVASLGEDTLAGFAYVQLYPAHLLAFFSYLVVDDRIPEARECRVSTQLVQKVAEFLRHSGACKRIVAELEEPTVLEGERAVDARARIRRLKGLAKAAQCSLKTVKMVYYQPKLDPFDQGDTAETRMRLMYGPLDPESEPRRLHKRDVSDLLSFLAESIYGDHFEHRADLDTAYRAYLEKWRARLLEDLPVAVELS